MKVTLIIPTYNRAGLLLEALASVRDQAWRPVEVIVVDDGSTDETAARFAEFQRENVAVDLGWALHTVPNAGAAAARNHGLRLATGEAVLFLDSDDALTPEGLPALARELVADSALELVHGRVRLVDDALRPLPEPELGHAREPGDPAELAGYHWHTMGALYRRELLRRSRGWCQEFSGSDDWVFQARVKLVAGSAARYVDTVVGLWRTHGGERLGAMTFRPDWTLDVTRACQLIWKEAAEERQGNPVLRRKLALRALRHAWELGRFGESAARAEAFRRTLEIAKGDTLLAAALHLARALPMALDALLHRWAEKRA